MAWKNEFIVNLERPAVKVGLANPFVHCNHEWDYPSLQTVSPIRIVRWTEIQSRQPIPSFRHRVKTVYLIESERDGSLACSGVHPLLVQEGSHSSRMLTKCDR